MARIQECVHRLREELEKEQRQFLAQRDALDQTLRELQELHERIGADGPAAKAGPAVRGLAERLEQRRAQLAEDRASRFGKWADMLEELTEEARREAGLSRLGELSASVAHEIRNPLCGIVLSLEVLQTKIDPEDSRAVLLENCRREAEKMEKVVNNLLHFARRYEPRPVECPLGQVVQKSLDAVRAHVEKRQVRVELHPTSLPCTAEVDPQLVQQVFTNLLLNALDASADGSTISVLTRTRGDEAAAVRVRDEGEGIPPDRLQSVFDPFYTSKPKGVGLGLSVSKKIVEAHGGNIEVESEVGVGTTFTVVVPRNAEHQPARAAA